MISEFCDSFSLWSDQVPVVFMPKKFFSSLNLWSDSWIRVLFHVLLTMQCLKWFLALLELCVFGSVASGFSWTMCRLSITMLLMILAWFLGVFWSGTSSSSLPLVNFLPPFEIVFFTLYMYLDWFTASKHDIGLSVLG